MLFLDTYSFLACVQTQTHAAKAMFVGRSKRVWEVTVIMAQPLLSFICLLRPGSRLMQQSPCSKSQIHTHTRSKGSLGDERAAKGHELQPAFCVYSCLFLKPPHWKVLVNAYVGGLIHFSFLHVYIWHFVS